MRILHMIDILSIGGAQKLLVTFGHEIKKSSNQMDVLCLESEKYSPVGQELQAMGIPVEYFPSTRLFDIKRMASIVRLLRETKPDVIHTHLKYANIIGGLTGFLAGIPVVATLHSTGTSTPTSRVINWLEEMVLKIIDRRVIAVGLKTAEVHQHRLGNKKIDFIPNAVSESVTLTNSERSNIRREILGDETRLFLISIGRFSFLKARNDLIRAFVQIHSRYPQSVLVLVGDGDLRSEAESLTKSLEMEQAVLFLGNRNDVSHLMAASDLFLNSSIVEGMPLGVMEAMMAGLPIVATSVGDLPFMMEDDRGVLVPPSQPDLFAEATCKLLQDVEKMKTMGARAQQYAMQNFSSAAWMNKLLSLYGEVI